MCEIKRHVKKPTMRVITVWKAIASTSTKHEWHPLTKWETFVRGQWVRAEQGPGFNCYKRPLRNYWSTDTIKCRARLVEGYGEMDGMVVIFAREIFVPTGRNKK